MAQEQNYSVNYTINVEATQGTRQVQSFADAVGNLVRAKADLTPVVNNIKRMMDEIDKVFRTKSGKKRDYNYKMSIDTAGTEEKLTRVKGLLGEIREMSKNINLVINATQPLDSKNIRAKAKALLNKKEAENRNAAVEKSAATSVKSMLDAQKSITKVIGKITAALVQLEKGREVNIKTDVAKQRLIEILGLMNQIKGASKMTLGMGMGSPGKATAARPIANTVKPPFVYNPQRAYVLPQDVSDKLNQRLITNRALATQKREFGREDAADKIRAQRLQQQIRSQEWDRQFRMRSNEARERQAANEAARVARDQSRTERQNAANVVTAARQQQRSLVTGQTNKQRAAINRLQYARTPSLRTLPMAHMLNAYMMYGFLRTELTKAIEYSNIMTSAQSILRVADTDLTTFENRFTKMALYVRKIGVETKFTAVEVAGAVKYLSMAGMGIDTINESIRPITNLALIGDNDVSQIADLATNIMAGYDIKSESMNSVADILASTISRSNVNIIEMAESYKMAAGYMRMAGVEFTESSAAIGILGNMGVKGTMAGTAMRAMATRFAKPTRESQKTLDRLGVKFTHMQDIYGKQVEKLRPLADIFEELNAKDATMGDMQAIFGKIGGNAAMMFVRNYEQLRTLTVQNQGSHGISSELAKVKQENTKGLWAQMTSQLTESFMQGYEIIEPIIKSTLRDLLEKFKSRDFAVGIAAIGQSILNLVSILGSVAAWFGRNFHWIEPLLFSGFVATRLFKLAGAITNIGVALGFMGKQSVAASGLQAITSLVGMGGGKLSFGAKRQIVTALSAAGVSGKGAMTQALGAMGVGGGLRGAGLFANQVATGNGLIGAGASIAALGTGALVATAGVTALIGAVGYLAYKTWKVKEAKDAVLEEIRANEKYRYPSIEALNTSLSKTYETALNAKKAVDELTAGKTIEESSGQKVGAFTGNWWTAVLSNMGSGMAGRYGGGYNYASTYSFADARQDDTRNAILTLARKDSQARINSAYAELGKARTDIEIGAFLQNVGTKFGQDETKLDKTLWSVGANGTIIYKKGIGDMNEADAYKLYDYAKYMNGTVVPEINRFAGHYRQVMSSNASANAQLRAGGLNFKAITDAGFYQDKEGNWVEKELPKNATDADRTKALGNRQLVHDMVVKFTSALRQTWGGSEEIAKNIMEKAGFRRFLYSNEPDLADKQPFNANGITFNPGDPDDGLAGGNYSGTGKLSSAAPKQVIVNITNLLSVEAIKILKSEDGKSPEVQGLKEQLAQALIDVVHDFDASWNG